ncbi:MAG TPA: hypothetical protein GXX46_00385 [Peptococcaceae bacterium]|nr:hypothetical protein [Peptococcaceae bacterium]
MHLRPDEIKVSPNIVQFLCGKETAYSSPDPDNPKNVVDLDSVHALQLLSKYVPGKRATIVMS